MTHLHRFPSRSAQLFAGQDEWAQAGFSNKDRCFGISKVAFDMEGLVSSVLWEKLGQTGNQGITRQAVVSVKTVVAAIRDGHPVIAVFPGMAGGLPERRFVVEERGWRGATVVLDGAPAPGRNMHDLYVLFLEGVGAVALASARQTIDGPHDAPRRMSATREPT